jgi:undecaprenyl-phosphate 4-deoxy-4-formamido-L-arabinose transferase
MTVNFSILPLRLGTLLGLAFSIVGLLGAMAVIFEKVRHPELPLGWPSVTVSVLLLSGVQLFLLGLLGEYLGQLVLTINGTPQYVVRNVVEEKAPSHGD